MPNALAISSGPPPAPDMPQGAAQAMGTAPTGSPQGMPPGAPQGGPMPPQQPPAPSHQQTVAALRHFAAVEKELEPLIKDPDLGKTDMRPKAIDGVTKLVASGILTPTQAVDQLSQFPDDPFKQKQMLQQMYVQTIIGQKQVLAQHGQAFAGVPFPPGATPPNAKGRSKPSGGAVPDDHQNTMASLMAHYKASNVGR